MIMIQLPGDSASEPESKCETPWQLALSCYPKISWFFNEIGRFLSVSTRNLCGTYAVRCLQNKLDVDVRFRLSITWAICIFAWKLKRFSSLP